MKLPKVKLPTWASKTWEFMNREVTIRRLTHLMMLGVAVTGVAYTLIELHSIFAALGWAYFFMYYLLFVAESKQSKEWRDTTMDMYKGYAQFGLWVSGIQARLDKEEKEREAKKDQGVS